MRKKLISCGFVGIFSLVIPMSYNEENRGENVVDELRARGYEPVTQHTEHDVGFEQQNGQRPHIQMIMEEFARLVHASILAGIFIAGHLCNNTSTKYLPFLPVIYLYREHLGRVGVIGSSIVWGVSFYGAHNDNMYLQYVPLTALGLILSEFCYNVYPGVRFICRAMGNI